MLELKEIKINYVPFKWFTLLSKSFNKLNKVVQYLVYYYEWCCWKEKEDKIINNNDSKSQINPIKK